MKCELIHDNGSSRLILIFAGWSTDASFYAHIDHPGYDVMVAYDYSGLDFPTEILDRYDTICLFAWSLGVYAAAVSLPFDRITSAVAVNGTERPADDKFGIPESVFDGTTVSMNERNLMKFRRRMAGKDYETIKDRFRPIPVDELRLQLEFIRRHSGQNERRGIWNRVYISRNDAIFPPSNQQAYWASLDNAPETFLIEGPHYVDLAAVVNGVIPRHDLVGKRFEKALPTYSEQAVAQRRIAEHLLRMIPDMEIGKALEAGPGSGVFSSMFAGRFHPDEMDFVELYKLPDFDVAPAEHYHIADAERWMQEESFVNPGTYDAIVSASAIQWFVNLPLFIKNAARLLRHGGVLACSSFLPGNLDELSAVNPFPLIYRTADEISDMLSDDFKDVSIETDTIPVDFNSPRGTLAHIRHTGVGGSSKSRLPLHELLAGLPSRLTYRPVFFIAIKS